MNTKAIGETVGKILESIVPTSDEIRKTMAGFVEKGKYWKITKNGLRDGVTYEQNEILKNTRYFTPESMKSIGLDESEVKQAQKLLQNISPDNVESTFDQLKNINPNNEKFQKALNLVSSRIINGKPTIDPANVEYDMGLFTFYANTPKAYFSNPDPGIKKTRIGAAGALLVLLLAQGKLRK